ncbi:MAG: hypothetical protein FGM37_02100 [Phycisphaerales bacterium]|nr:hypothetical protein [Phycisphaerales bacterium]
MTHQSSRAARSAATAIALTAAAGAVTSAHSADRLVPQQYASIQAAINASAAGDHVAVAPGSYTESINFLGKQLVVRPQGQVRSVTLRAQVGSRSVTFANGESPSTVLRGFRLVGNGASGSQGGGVRITGASPTIEHCEIVDVHSSQAGGEPGPYGGAVEINSGNPVIRSCEFRGNRASTSGTTAAGGAIIIRAGSPLIEGCSFWDSPGAHGADVYVAGSAPVVARVVSCAFQGRSGTGHGSRIYNHGNGNGSGTIILQDCRFLGISHETVSLIHGWDNIVLRGVEFDSCMSATGAIITTSRGLLTVEACRFEDNTIGLIWIDPQYGSRGVVSGSRFCGNAPYPTPFGAAVTDSGSNSVSAQCCRGDITGNGHVDGLDLAAVLSAWGTTGDTEFNTDVDRDGLVGGADLAYVLSGWGACPE